MTHFGGSWRRWVAASVLLLGLWEGPGARAGQEEPGGGFLQAMTAAERALEAKNLDQAREWIERALERDPRSVQAWRLRVRWAEAREDQDEVVYALHQAFRHARAQKLGAAVVERDKQAVLAADPIAKDLYSLDTVYSKKLGDLAARYEKEGRPHAAITVLKTVLALDPLNEGAAAAIERIAARPDPSLAADAKPKDLFADVSREWIEEHDRTHADWDTRAKLERENYDTYTDAGYEVLVRAGEAMEQMNAFYRRFFRYGTEEDGRSVPRIALHIFKNRDEYLKLGKGPPVEWSAGHFTGDSVETYIDGGFDGMTGTLFHEAAHQFVSLATSAAGWLNEGLASFFEGTRMLPNGTVLMNLPANHRLFPLAARMEKGWMSGPTDGIGADGKGEPERAPTFSIVLENKYAWGPPWYAPTWGVVYFLYNYQDPVDGRFVYRKSFGDFVNASGGREGEGAVENFEKVVLENPMPPIKGFVRPEGAVDVALPKTAADLDSVWKSWMLELRDEQQGKLERVRPYLDWARAAILAGDLEAAQEHFEKGLVAGPSDVAVRLEFAGLLADKLKNPDRAAKLVEGALSLLEAAKVPDPKAIAAAERLLARYDPKRESLEALQKDMAVAARGIVERYAAAERPLLVMDVAWRLGTDLGVSELFAYYERAARVSGKSLRIWDLAYNERDLTGWSAAGASGPFSASGTFLDAKFGEFDPENFDYQALTLDRTTSGDFSMEADVLAERGKVTFAGFVFGRKDVSSFHGLFFFPGKEQKQGLAAPGYVDLLSSFGANVIKTWRHMPVDTSVAEGASTAGAWHKLRVDVAGRFVDFWFDGTLLATQEFASIDVLRGSFGLMTGHGSARFRNVRYLASDPRDPVAGIERTLRLAKLAGRSARETGSYLGVVPPWPKVGRWVQGERKSWEEAGRVPQLLVFFSIEQNDMVRLDQWLTAFEADARRFGVQVVSIASPNDEKRLEEYLKTHPLPGAVAFDYRAPKATGIGESFEQFFIRRFNLPRILLLDVDQRVVWEGDPGLVAATPWKAGDGSFVDAPLEDLVARHKLDRLPAFTTAWKDKAVPALAKGDLAAALETLRASQEFEADYYPDVAQAQARLAMLESALANPVSTAQGLIRDGADPAIATLLEWYALCGGETTPKLAKELKPLLESKGNKEWAAAGKACTRWKNLMARKDPDAAAAAVELLGSLEALQGTLPREFAAELKAAREAQDSARFAALVGEFDARPRLWLAQSHFGWK
jgi:tetratricopeptide (TPR) repeat protein